MLRVNQAYAIPAKIRRGGFSSEKSCTIKTAADGEYMDVAYYELCFHQDGTPLKQEDVDDVNNRDAFIEGYVACKLLDHLNVKDIRGKRVTINLPSVVGGSVNIYVKGEDLILRPGTLEAKLDQVMGKLTHVKGKLETHLSWMFSARKILQNLLVGMKEPRKSLVESLIHECPLDSAFQPPTSQGSDPIC